MKSDLLYLEHILTSINKIKQYTNSGKDAFMNSPITQDAVIRNLEIIVKLLKRYPVNLDRIIHRHLGNRWPA